MNISEQWRAILKHLASLRDARTPEDHYRRHARNSHRAVQQRRRRRSDCHVQRDASKAALPMLPANRN
jgi:hypothetical protein